MWCRWILVSLVPCSFAASIAADWSPASGQSWQTDGLWSSQVQRSALCPLATLHSIHHTIRINKTFKGGFTWGYPKIAGNDQAWDWEFLWYIPFFVSDCQINPHQVGIVCDQLETWDLAIGAELYGPDPHGEASTEVQGLGLWVLLCRKITGSKCRIRTWKTRGKVVQISAQVHSIRLLGKGAVFAADVFVDFVGSLPLGSGLVGPWGRFLDASDAWRAKWPDDPMTFDRGSPVGSSWDQQGVGSRASNRSIQDVYILFMFCWRCYGAMPWLSHLKVGSYELLFYCEDEDDILLMGFCWPFTSHQSPVHWVHCLGGMYFHGRSPWGTL